MIKTKEFKNFYNYLNIDLKGTYYAPFYKM